MQSINQLFPSLIEFVELMASTKIYGSRINRLPMEQDTRARVHVRPAVAVPSLALLRPYIQT
jgi:hypothetical protein